MSKTLPKPNMPYTLKQTKATKSSDDPKRFDYVIVVPKSIKKSQYYSSVVKFLNNLQVRGIQLDLAFGNIQDNIYVKLRIVDKFVNIYASIYNINIRKKLRTNPLSIIHIEKFKTPLSLNPNVTNGEPTTSDRIAIIYLILNETTFGETHETDKYGINKLLRLGAVKDAYPLHDGPSQIDTDEDEFLNDRQYWASFSLWYKEQPLNMIEKYFGTEVAFYFAWLGFYNMMLIPASLVGVVCFLISLFKLLYKESTIVNDVCTSELILCPRCVFGNECIARPLKIECLMTKAFTTFDNATTTFFAVFMSFWATLLRNLWKQKEYVLRQRWNVITEVDKTQLRLQYKEKTTYLRKSEITGALEPYTPTVIQTFYYFLSYGTCLLLIGMLLLVMFGVTLFRILLVILFKMSNSKFLKFQALLLVPICSAILQVIFIKFYGKFYAPLSEWLTNIENPRTQFEFDNSVIHKRYILGFANNYGPLFYIGFFKGRLYTPARSDVVSPMTDFCTVHGCIVGLCIQLFVLMLLKSLAGNILILFKPRIRNIQRTITGNPTRTLVAPQAEEEYNLIPAGRYLLTTEFMEMIIQYGFVTFFVAAFPLAPLCALINNCLELRLDALKLVQRYRRPVPKRHSGIGAWGNILGTVTQISIATNAFVMAFTSHFVSKLIYGLRHPSLKGYMESRLSIYDLADTDQYKGKKIIGMPKNSTLCYYHGLRYPPNHPHKYERTYEYWFDISMRLAGAIIFEHVILITNGLLSYFIAKKPNIIKEAIHYFRNIATDGKLEEMHNEARRKMQAKNSVK